MTTRPYTDDQLHDSFASQCALDWLVMNGTRRQRAIERARAGADVDLGDVWVQAFADWCSIPDIDNNPDPQLARLAALAYADMTAIEALQAAHHAQDAEEVDEAHGAEKRLHDLRALKMAEVA